MGINYIEKVIHKYYNSVTSVQEKGDIAVFKLFDDTDKAIKISAFSIAVVVVILPFIITAMPGIAATYDKDVHSRSDATAISKEETENYGWIDENGTYYYKNEDGSFITSATAQIDGLAYYFDENSALCTGRYYLGDTEYYSDDNGVIIHDTWVMLDDEWYYIGSNSEILKDCTSPDGYVLDELGHIVDDENVDNTITPFTYSNGYNRQMLLKVGVTDVIWNYLKDKGWTSTAIAGVLGNFEQESGMNPNRHQTGGNGYGLGQWTGGRRTNLEKFAAARGTAADNIITQLDFMLSEKGEMAFVSKYSQTEFASPAKAAIEWGYKWERYKRSDGSMSRTRIPYAEAYYAYYVEGVSFMTSTTQYTEKSTTVAENISSENIDTNDSSSEELKTDNTIEGEPGATLSDAQLYGTKEPIRSQSTKIIHKR